MYQIDIPSVLNTAVRAGRAIINIYERDDQGIQYKKDESPLTEADLASNNVIIEALENTGLPILSEEGRDIPFSARKHWELFWLVDPLDGTKEFIKRNGEFTVNIALINKHEPVFGVIYAPVPDLLYFGGKDYQSLRMENVLNTDEITGHDITHKSTKLPLKEKGNAYRIVASRSHRNEETENFIMEMGKKHELEFVPKGSSLKFCVVAEGAADCYPRFAPTMEWDTGAGHAIAEGAQCTVQQVHNNDLTYNKEQLLNPYFIVYGC